ncbi:YkgJ family cysteine cluster protein [Leptolyngbya sp. 7M]|uniref:YkgJ family cysteine cluster protein n=1 Tax=Leptolyngbya sp. 7M TaxID=2812896 RepID=UPI001B8C0413|nr:YkgJ family cysteine cluster protein [Leptolyngbya sp. 7M]QYO67581.1 YkgJ family cysteine cluster protein [Leptolyngbya sp. 7M]
MAELVQIERIRKRDFNSRILEMDAGKKKAILPPQLPLELLSKKLEESVTIELAHQIPDCTSCGVCCAFALIVPITYSESESVPAYVDILLDDADEEIVIDRVLPRAENGRCANLEGELGGPIGCRIYNDRPSLCHDFDAGSDRCHEYRRMYGIEGQLSEEEAKVFREKLLSRPHPMVIEDVSIVSSGHVERMSISAEGEAEQTFGELLTIWCFLNDETPIEIHTFEYGKEKWFEGDLLGLTMDEARKRIEEQAGW